MQTQAWVLVEINKLELLDIELPPLKDGQALVEILYTSICGSQLNEIYGRKEEDKFLPHLLGHEAVVKILEVKDESNRYSLNNEDIAVATWINGVGQSVAVDGILHRGNSTYYINAGPITTFSKHAIISLNKLVKINEKFAIPEQALLGCSIPTGGGSLRYCNSKQLCVIGLGGVGMAACLEARHRGLDVIGIDINEFKLQYASKHKIQIQHEVRGVDTSFIFESSGSKSAMESAFSVLRNGGTLVLAGNLPKGQKIEIDPFGFINKKQIIGVVGGDCSHEDIRSFAQRLDIFKPLISKEYNLYALDQAVVDLAAGNIIKPIIKC